MDTRARKRTLNTESSDIIDSVVENDENDNDNNNQTKRRKRSDESKLPRILDGKYFEIISSTGECISVCCSVAISAYINIAFNC